MAAGKGGYFSPPLPRVLAHRGFAGVRPAPPVPENTLAAFAAAVSAGVGYIETDVHASADGVAIISHDPDLRRVVGRAIAVCDLTAAQLAEVDLGGGHGFATLRAALDANPGIRFNIDVKSADAVLPTVRAVTECAALDRVLVTSFSEARRSAAVRHLPGVASSASASRFALAYLALQLRAPVIARRALRGIAAVQIPETYHGLRVVSAETVRRMHALGVEVHVWTVDDEADMRRLLALGVDGLVTDRSDLAIKVVRNTGPGPRS